MSDGFIPAVVGGGIGLILGAVLLASSIQRDCETMNGFRFGGQVFVCLPLPK